jgi:hypothetical protein
MRHERYMTHLRWHSGERPFACAMCEKSFRDRSELNRHSRRHTGDLPYKCNTCGKGFLRKERYITHMRIHTGEKPFVCGVCSRGYRDKRELKKHQATHNHGDPSDSPEPMDDPPSPAPLPPAPQTVTVIEAPQQPVVAQPRTVTIASQPSPQKALALPVQPAPTQNMATLTFSLPTEPVPKNQLGLAPPIMQPQTLNPAQIALPPSVATALQTMNQKAAKQQAVQVVQTAGNTQIIKMPQGMQQGGQLIQLEGEGGQQIVQMVSGASLPPGLVAAAGNQPMFYYFMPSAAVQPSYTATESGTIRVAASEGGPTQVFTLPAGAFQGGSGPVQIQVPVSGASMGQMQYILETTSQPPNSASGRPAAI